MIFYDFKAGLNQKECVQRLQLELDDGFPCHATVFRWFEEFFRGRNYLQDEEHTASTKKRNVSESVKKSLKLPNYGHRFVSKIVMDDETYMPFYDVSTRQESKVWVFEDDPMPTMVKSQRAMKKVMYAISFRSTGLIKTIKLEGQKTVNVHGTNASP
ncbi:UNVERIFIED_CONTAM: hypothetical protein NCL1_56859 [Trichonephila clavipes]